MGDWGFLECEQAANLLVHKPAIVLIGPPYSCELTPCSDVVHGLELRGTRWSSVRNGHLHIFTALTASSWILLYHS